MMDFERTVAFILCVIVSSTMSASVSYVLRLRAAQVLVSGASEMSGPDQEMRSYVGYNMTAPVGSIGTPATTMQMAALLVSAISVVILSVGSFILFLRRHDYHLQHVQREIQREYERRELLLQTEERDRLSYQDKHANGNGHAKISSRTKGHSSPCIVSHFEPRTTRSSSNSSSKSQHRKKDITPCEQNITVMPAEYTGCTGRQ